MASPFVDKVTIQVRAGRGGDGAVSFHREKYVAAGGPDGGDGGRGGDIVFRADDNMSTLMDFRYKRKFAAGDGQNGQGKRCSGKDGESVVLRVPGARCCATPTAVPSCTTCPPARTTWPAAAAAAAGATSTSPPPPARSPASPSRACPARSTPYCWSSSSWPTWGSWASPMWARAPLLSVVSNAHPKIANYHFTTLFPNLGVVYVDEHVSFVLADIPGIIEGASDGAGLGHDFLRHIDRCRLLIHLVDVSGSEGRDPVEDFETINAELERYSPQLASRPQLVAANKCDLLDDAGRENLERLRAHVEGMGLRLFEISAAATTGTRELMRAAAAELQHLPPIAVYEPDYVPPAPDPGRAEDVQIKREGDTWYLEGEWLARLVASVNFSDYESRMYFDRNLRAAGIYDRMEAMGIRDGDTVSIYDIEFEYQR